MTDLTPDQRKRVAEAVDGRRHVVRNDLPHEPIWNVDGGSWIPHYRSDQWRELLQWISKSLGETDYPIDFVGDGRFVCAIANDDTAALEQMAHEILEARHD